MPFPLCLSSKVNLLEQETQITEISIAMGNNVLADYGITIESKNLIPPSVQEGSNYRPGLADKNITFREEYHQEQSKKFNAGSALKQNLDKVLPKINLFYEEEVWNPVLDLLGSDRFANEFVCETENDGSVYLRFGDDILGKKPSPGITFKPVYRVGNGKQGNVGSDSIKRILTDFNDIQTIKNPLPAVGGTDPETIERVKQIAPQAFRIQERAVTEADYSEVTQRHEEVQKAAANFRWTGSWNTVFVTVDRTSGNEVDESFREEINNHIEKYRLAGYDLEINKPVFVPLDIEFNVCVKDGYFRSNIKEIFTESI